LIVPSKTKKSSTKKSSKKKQSGSLKTVKGEKTTEKSAASGMPSREELGKLLDEHLHGMLILDEKSKIVYANQAAAKLLGKECDKLLGVRVTKLKSFSEATDQLAWLGKPCRLMIENTSTRRLAKTKSELKSSLDQLDQAQKDLTSLQRRADDSEERAEEMEGFLEQMEAQHSELESQLGELKAKEQAAQSEWEQTESELVGKISRLEKSLKEKSKELDGSNHLKLVAEMELEVAKRQGVLLSEEVAQLQDSSLSQDSVLAQRVETLNSLLLQADDKEAGFVRRIAELESTLKEFQDQTTIAKYDLNEAVEKYEATLEKLKATQEKLKDAEGRVEAAAGELFKAWEVAEAAESTSKEADSLREKAEQRTAELEEIMEKITPEDDDTIMGFL
jgi:chromosome segregation ATPase